MSNAAKTSRSTHAAGSGEGFDLGKMLLEGRAFFALIAIIVIFFFPFP